MPALRHSADRGEIYESSVIKELFGCEKARGEGYKRLTNVGASIGSRGRKTFRCRTTGRNPQGQEEKLGKAVCRPGGSLFWFYTRWILLQVLQVAAPS